MGARILIIEDNPTNLELLRFLLEAHGHSIQCATDGDEGLRLAQQYRPDLIICDLHLPRFDGYQVAKRLKGQQYMHSIPLIAVTAFAMAADRDKALAAGYDGYFAKPINPETFLDDIERYLPRSMRSSAAQKPSVEEIEGIVEPYEKSGQAEPRPQEVHGTILVVDESITNCELLRLMLEPSGYRVLFAENASEAVRIVDTRQVDMVLAAIHQSQSNGLHLIEGLRERSSTPVPVIVLSSTASDYETRHKAMAMGAAGFICQPVDPVELFTEIERCRHEVLSQVSGDSQSGGDLFRDEEREGARNGIDSSC